MQTKQRVSSFILAYKILLNIYRTSDVFTRSFNPGVYTLSDSTNELKVTVHIKVVKKQKKNKWVFRDVADNYLRFSCSTSQNSKTLI